MFVVRFVHNNSLIVVHLSCKSSISLKKKQLFKKIVQKALNQEFLPSCIPQCSSFELHQRLNRILEISSRSLKIISKKNHWKWNSLASIPLTYRKIALLRCLFAIYARVFQCDDRLKVYSNPLHITQSLATLNGRDCATSRNVCVTNYGDRLEHKKRTFD